MKKEPEPEETKRKQVLEKIKEQVREKPSSLMEVMRDGILEFLELVIKIDNGVSGYKFLLNNDKIIIEIYRRKGALLIIEEEKVKVMSQKFNIQKVINNL